MSMGEMEIVSAGLVFVTDGTGGGPTFVGYGIKKIKKFSVGAYDIYFSGSFPSLDVARTIFVPLVNQLASSYDHFNIAVFADEGADPDYGDEAFLRVSLWEGGPPPIPSDNVDFSFAILKFRSPLESADYRLIVLP